MPPREMSSLVSVNSLNLDSIHKHQLWSHMHQTRDDDNNNVNTNPLIHLVHKYLLDSVIPLYDFFHEISEIALLCIVLDRVWKCGVINSSVWNILSKIITDSCYSDTSYQSKHFFICMCKAYVKLMACVFLTDSKGPFRP